MKKTIYSALIVIIYALLNPIGICSQEMMFINKIDNSVLKIPISDIENITYGTSATSSSTNTVTDIDGNVYNTVKIGTQTWMQTDLKVTKLNDGAPISLVMKKESWGKTTAPAFCWYDNENPDPSSPYGAIYNGFAVKMKTLCPKGWHVSTTKDWETLLDFCGDMAKFGPIKLKESGRAHWLKNDKSVTNETGFTALPNGYRNSYGNFSFRGGTGSWWTSTVNKDAKLFKRAMHNSNSPVTIGAYDNQFGSCVRCIMD